MIKWKCPSCGGVVTPFYGVVVSEYSKIESYRCNHCDDEFQTTDVLLDYDGKMLNDYTEIIKRLEKMKYNYIMTI